MYKRQSKKRDNYYGLVTDLYFKKGMSVRAISKKNITFADHHPEMDMFICRRKRHRYGTRETKRTN